MISAENNKNKGIKGEIKIMVKSEFITKVQEKIDIEVSKKDLNTILDGFVSVIKEAVLAGDTVTIPEICKISSKDVAERSGVTKLGGVEKPWSTPAKDEISVKISKSYKAI